MSSTHTDAANKACAQATEHLRRLGHCVRTIGLSDPVRAGAVIRATTTELTSVLGETYDETKSKIDAFEERTPAVLHVPRREAASVFGSAAECQKRRDDISKLPTFVDTTSEPVFDPSVVTPEQVAEKQAERAAKEAAEAKAKEEAVRLQRKPKVDKLVEEVNQLLLSGKAYPVTVNVPYTMPADVVHEAGRIFGAKFCVRYQFVRPERCDDYHTLRISVKHACFVVDFDILPNLRVY